MSRWIRLFEFNTLNRDEWRSLQGSLTLRERRLLIVRRWSKRLYLLLRGAVLAPVGIPRGVAHLVGLAMELERLHFGPARKIAHGSGCVIDKQTWIINGQNIRFGHNVKISAFSSIMAGYRSTVTIGDNSIVGPGVTIVAFNHGSKDTDLPIRFQPWEDSPAHSIIIGSNVWIGARAVVLPSSIISDNAIIGAGTIVRGTVPSHSILVGKLDNQLVPIPFRT